MPYEKSDEDLPKQAQDLPEHAKHIYRESHNSALKHYKENPDQIRGDQTADEVAHKVAWDSVKKEYKRESEDNWVKKGGYDDERHKKEDETGKNIED